MKKFKFEIIDTYTKIIEVKAGTAKKARELVGEQAAKMRLCDLRLTDTDVEFERSIEIQIKDQQTDSQRLDRIAEETEVNWYQTMQPWQRKDLSKEELYQYAEGMRQALERIYDITTELDRSIYAAYR